MTVNEFVTLWGSLRPPFILKGDLIRVIDDNGTVWCVLTWTALHTSKVRYDLLHWENAGFRLGLSHDGACEVVMAADGALAGTIRDALLRRVSP